MYRYKSKYNIFTEALQEEKRRRYPGGANAVQINNLVYFRDIIWCGLINIVIEPVGIKQLAGASPTNNWGAGGIVVREVVIGDMDRKALVLVPKIFPGEGVRIILRVTGDEELAGVLTLYGKDPSVPGDGKELQTGGSPDVALVDLGIPGVGRLEDVVEAAEQGGAWF